MKQKQILHSWDKWQEFVFSLFWVLPTCFLYLYFKKSWPKATVNPFIWTKESVDTDLPHSMCPWTTQSPKAEVAVNIAYELGALWDANMILRARPPESRGHYSRANPVYWSMASMHTNFCTQVEVKQTKKEY